MKNIIFSVLSMFIASSSVADINVPEGQDTITWVFAECRAIDAASSRLELKDDYYNQPGYESKNKWETSFWNLALSYYKDNPDITRVGNGRADAMAKIELDLLTNRLNTENWDAAMLNCGEAYKLLTMDLVKKMEQ